MSWSHKLIRLLALGAGLASLVGAGPAPSGSVAFEAASIKQSPPLDETGRRLFDFVWDSASLHSLPGTNNRVEIRNATLAQLIALAYKTRPRMIVGPSWISDTRFEIVATIPSGHARQEGWEMLQNLLAERFALRAHRDTRKMSGYTISIGKNGPKLKAAAPVVPTEDASTLLNHPRPPLHGDNLWELEHADMAQLADVLSQNLHAPVEDQTALKGYYAITIRIAASDKPDDVERAARFQEALSNFGLRLSAGPVQAAVIVVDSAFKTPTAN
jgi:uncharacterized protein (TIGR03435 family)